MTTWDTPRALRTCSSAAVKLITELLFKFGSKEIISNRTSMQVESTQKTNGTTHDTNGKAEVSQMVAEEVAPSLSEEMTRFQSDLEFVQFLSNPNYIQCKCLH